MGDASGRLYEVFDPPWWRPDQWIWWWLLPFAIWPKRLARGTLTFIIDGKERTVRTRQIPNNIPFCAEYEVDKEDRHDQ